MTLMPESQKWPSHQSPQTRQALRSNPRTMFMRIKNNNRVFNSLASLCAKRNIQHSDAHRIATARIRKVANVTHGLSTSREITIYADTISVFNTHAVLRLMMLSIIPFAEVSEPRQSHRRLARLLFPISYIFSIWRHRRFSTPHICPIRCHRRFASANV
jgi:hypothetical protein